MANGQRPPAAPDPPRLKLALVISGAVALGSFESGVIRELARAARAADGPFTIDLIAGSSAGAITGAQVARALLAPEPDFDGFAIWTEATLRQFTRRYRPDETSPLSQSWVAEQIRATLTGGAAASATEPLAGGAAAPATEPPAGGSATAAATEPLADGSAAAPATEPLRPGHPPQERVRLLVTVTDLEGSVHRISRESGLGVPMAGLWHGATVAFDLHRDAPPATWERVAQVVQASCAHSAAWEAVPLRVPDQNQGPEHWEPPDMFAALRARQQAGRELYFTDGGTINNLPLGAAVQMLPRHAPDWRRRPQLPFDPYRVVLYVEPDPLPPDPQPDDYRRWVRTARQALQIVTRSPVTRGDLKWLGESNQQVAQLLRAVADAARALARELPEGERPPTPLILPRAMAEAAPAVAEAPAPPFPGAAPAADAAPAATPAPAPAADAAPGAAPQPAPAIAPVPPAPPSAGSAHAQAVLDGSVAAFYQWLDAIGGRDPQRPPLENLTQYLRDAPLGETPPNGGGYLCTLTGQPTGNATAEIRAAVLAVAEQYYRFRELEQEGVARGLVAYLQGVHRWLLGHNPAGDRQWVYVTRITPTEPRPLSRELGHFGGFLYQPWLAYDYALGRRRAIQWLREMFPDNPYVRRELQVLPELPRVAHQDLQPAIWAANIPSLAAMLRQLLRSAREELPWLDNPLLRLAARGAGAALTAVLLWLVGARLGLWAALDPPLWGYAVAGALGMLAATLGAVLWGRRSLELKLGLAIAGWALVHYGRQAWVTVSAALAPGRRRLPHSGPPE